MIRDQSEPRADQLGPSTGTVPSPQAEHQFGGSTATRWQLLGWVWLGSDGKRSEFNVLGDAPLMFSNNIRRHGNTLTAVAAIPFRPHTMTSSDGDSGMYPVICQSKSKETSWVLQ